MRVKDITPCKLISQLSSLSLRRVLTRDIDPQHPPKHPFQWPFRDRTCFPKQDTLARDPKWVQHIECIISQPRDKPWYAIALQVPDKVAVAYDLCDGPGEEHGTVEGRGCRGGGVLVDDSPNEKEARGDLHGSCEQGGADKAWGKDDSQL